MKKCVKCGNEFEERFKFCPECGSATGMSGASGIEDGVSIGNLRTMAGSGQGDMGTARGDARPSDGEAQSMGDMRTMGPQEAGGREAGRGNGVPLADRYELLEEIGRGGFAKVWKARDRKLGRLVAIKRLLSDARQNGTDDQTLTRFRREAQSIAQLNHRNIVAVYDHDRDAEGDYIVMEYVDGGTLRDYLKRQGGALPVAEAVALVRGIVQGLSYAHRQNLVHRDIKPGNILLSRDHSLASGRKGFEYVPKIADFGLARIGTESDLSVSGYGMGTPWYMPPEQRRDAKSVNHTADIYALGKVLYELVSGDVPDNVDSDKVPEVWLSSIILKCIKSAPGERYFSCDDLLQALSEGQAQKQAVAGAAKNSGNTCPACGSSNAEGVLFCEKCGAGLTRTCPECGRENSIHKQFCGGCGTDVVQFAKVSDTLNRMKRYAEERRWSRVIKEGALLADCPVSLRGNKGKALIAAMEYCRTQAAEAIEAPARIRKPVDERLAAGAFVEAMAIVKETLKVDQQNSELISLAKKIRHAFNLSERVKEAANAGDSLAAKKVMVQLTKILGVNKWAQLFSSEIDRRLNSFDEAVLKASHAKDSKQYNNALIWAYQALSDAPKSVEAARLSREIEDAIASAASRRRRFKIMSAVFAFLAAGASIIISRNINNRIKAEVAFSKWYAQATTVGIKSESKIEDAPAWEVQRVLFEADKALAEYWDLDLKHMKSGRCELVRAQKERLERAQGLYSAAMRLKKGGPVPGESWVSPATGMVFVWRPELNLWVGKYEVTNGEYRKKKPTHDYKGVNGHRLNGDRQPVVYVNFDDAKAYAAWMSELERERLDGMSYRVISEDEWYACAQSGDRRIYPWGSKLPPKYGNYAKMKGCKSGFAVTCPVERSGSNEWGLYGLGGNVWECCASDRSGSAFGAWRGASWYDHNPDRLRLLYRLNYYGEWYRDYYLGFRLVLSR